MSISELQALSTRDVNHLFKAVENQTYKKLRDNVERLEIEATNTIKFTQEKEYSIPQEQSITTPKFSSISIDSNNRQIATILFTGTPDLTFIKNKLHLKSVKYTSYTSDNIHIPYSALTIEENSISALAKLINIYNKISIEAESLIWEALKVVLKDTLNKHSDTPIDWKLALSYEIDAWADSITASSPDYQISYYNLNEYFDYQAKVRYSQLASKDKPKFLEYMIDKKLTSETQAVVDLMEAQDIANLVNDNNTKYKIIKDAFNSVEKCNLYIENNTPYNRNFIDQAQHIVKDKLEEQAAPGFLEQVFDDNIKKNTKAGVTITKATVSLLKIANINLGSIITAGTDVTNLLLAGSHFGKTVSNKVQMDTIKEVSDLFICMNLICNVDFITKLTKESNAELMEFYSTFLYQTIKRNDYENDVLDYLLDKVSDPQYIKDLGLETKGKKLLLTKTDEELTIIDFITLSQNKDSCYDSLLEQLTMEPISSPKYIPQITNTIYEDELIEEDNICLNEMYVNLDYSEHYTYGDYYS